MGVEKWGPSLPEKLDLIIASEILFSNKTRDPAVEEDFIKALPEYGFKILETVKAGGLPEESVYYQPRVSIFKLGLAAAEEPSGGEGVKAEEEQQQRVEEAEADKEE